MKPLLQIALATFMFCTTGCSLLLKNAVNKKFPPVYSIDKKINSVNESAMVLKETGPIDGQATVSGLLLDTASKLELVKSNGGFVLNNKIIDSLRMHAFKASLELQEASINSSLHIYLTPSTNKWISGVDFEVSASLSPYFSNDTVYFNPYFNRIHVHRVYFKKCAFLTKLKPLTELLNSIFDSYLDNINGRIKNYYVRLTEPGDQQVKLSSIFKGGPGVVIEKDGTIASHKKIFCAAVLVDTGTMRFLLGESKPDSTYSNIAITRPLSKNQKERKFFSLYHSYEKQFDSVTMANFDSVQNVSNYLVKFDLTTAFLESTINDALSNIDFRFNYPVSYSVAVDKAITIGKPNPDCGCDGIVNHIFNCGGGFGGVLCRAARGVAMGACYAGSFSIPGISTYMTYCLAMKSLPANFQWDIGTVKGEARADCLIHGILNKISFSNNFSSAAIVKQLLADGNINYDFHFSAFNSFNTGSAIFAILTQCPYLELKGGPSVQGAIPNNFIVELTKLQEAGKSSLKVTIDPFRAAVNLSQSPGMALLSDFRNVFTCNIGYGVVGAVFVMAHILPGNVIPEKFRDYFDLLTQGRLDHDFSVKSFQFPLDFKTHSVLGEINSSVYWGVKSINSICSFQ